MTEDAPHDDAGDAHVRARERVDTASTVRSRLQDEHENATGTSRELQAEVSLQAANDEVAARERWLQWVEEGDY
jgi:hypothetical protein